MKVILVPVADRPECRFALLTAFDMAGYLGADIKGYHLRPRREEKPSDRGARLDLNIAVSELAELPESQVRLNSANAEKLFRAMADEAGIAVVRKPRRAEGPLAFWHEMVGTPQKLQGIVGPVSDLIIVSRPKPRGSGPARAFLLSALLHSGKPLLVLPQRRVTNLGRRVLVAWNQSMQAASAMTAALPLLARASEVHIVCCGGEQAPGPKTRHARNYLAHWGIACELHRRKGRNTSAELLETYKEVGADLLVMGAYSHSQLRERILGGVTHNMLMQSNFPVIAMHH